MSTTPTINLDALAMLERLHPFTVSRDPLVRLIAAKMLPDIASRVGLTDAEIAAALDTAKRIAAAAVPPTMSAEEAQARRGKAKQEASSRMEKLGPEIWKRWHTRALTFTGIDIAFIAGVGRSLPCGDCANHLFKHLEENPPRFEEANFDYFAWTVEFHNTVRRFQKKPEMSVDEARTYYTALLQEERKKTDLAKSRENFERVTAQ